MPLITRAARRRPAMRIAVTSGKGGVGKTSLTINLSVALARLGHRVGVLDADFGLGNLDVLLGLTPAVHLGAVLAGDRTVDDIILEGPSGVRVIPAGSGVRALTALDESEWLRLAAAIDDACAGLDFLIIDTGAGISDNVLDVVGLADYAMVVTTCEPAALVDAYAVVKLVTAADPGQEMGVVVNAARDAEEADVVFRQIAQAAERFLGRTLRYDGFVIDDPAVREAVMDQSPVVGRERGGEADRCFRKLALRVARSWPSGAGPWPTRRMPVVIAAPPIEADPEAPQCA